MSLTKYRQKRDPSKTPEPFGRKKTDKQSLRFVVQKHAASHLHYDFRLEMRGVLKSWAVPKGPSTDPKVKRLAMMVEDHPYDYRDFEGIIPAGQYGGGTVIVWDEGSFEDAELEDESKAAQEKHLLHGLLSGKLKFILHGKKLKGAFALVRATGRGENGWLLMKLDDKYASSADILLKDKSVQSGKPIEKVAATSKHIYGEATSKAAAKKKPPAKTSPPKKQADKHIAASEQLKETLNTDVTALLAKAKRGKIPVDIKPMLATLVDRPFNDPDWVYEIKWDGYRTLAFLRNGQTRLLSRNNKSFDKKFYPIYDIIHQWKLNAVFDGEIVALDKKGGANFNALQNWRSEADAELAFYVFDILWYDGKNLMGLPLTERQAILKAVLPTGDDHIRLSTVFNVPGTEMFAAAQKMGLEGIMAKRADSVYTADLRSKEWLKIKVNKRQEVVIAGFTKNAGTSKTFSALLLAVYDKGKLTYAGKVGTGFSDKQQQSMMDQFKPLITDQSPFREEIDVDKPSRFRQRMGAKPTWLKPQLVCEISFAEITEDGVFRHPSFEGMRDDKKAKDVVRETEANTQKVVHEVNDQQQPAVALMKPPKDQSRKTLLNPTNETQVRTINGHELKFTNLSKVFWPKEGYTKRDLFNYYYQVAEYILPYLKDRPQSLNRFPNGISKPGFYQKDVKGKSPGWVKTFPYTTSEGENKEFLVGDNEATLLWMASLGCIEMNPWFSRIQSPDHPDYCVLDLDPDKNTFNQVIQVAVAIKEVLDAISVPCFCKTSGSTGLHIYIPLAAAYTYDQSQMFGRLIVDIVQQQFPSFTSLERIVKNRKGKMYLDFLQNRPGATLACPYSLRPKPGATVSMPLHWDELKPGLKMTDFTIKNAVQRIKETGDLFKPVLGKGINLESALKKYQKVFER
ncbi:DNA ligase D [Niabella pedocola]|uniref:DNA ligase (ATP) n=1 Tax=Niabella pedocola TaxID=1752077 RepID=A0ABS8PM74_9BACT|nr:DNA ligase D [Niabella pedocola]MCD2421397.1 DNA ligase D [Niabella pedocola]